VRQSGVADLIFSERGSPELGQSRKLGQTGVGHVVLAQAQLHQLSQRREMQQVFVADVTIREVQPPHVGKLSQRRELVRG